MPRSARPAPSAVCAGWPGRQCDDPAVEKVRLLSIAVDRAMGGRSLRAVAGEVGVDFTVLSDLVAGRSWPDSRTVALLEVGLDRALWPPHEGAGGAIHGERPEGVQGRARDTPSGPDDSESSGG